MHALLLGAPDKLFQNPYVPEEMRRTLESTVEELHRGVDHVFHKPRHESARTKLHDAIDATYAEFKAGRVHEGRMMWHEIGNLISETQL